MTDSLFAPSHEVLYKQYHTSELVESTFLGPSTQGDGFVRLKYSRKMRILRTHQLLSVRCTSICALYPPPPCISYALVQATVGVGTVITVYVILITYEM